MELAAAIVHAEMYHMDPFFYAIHYQDIHIIPPGEPEYAVIYDEPVTEVVVSCGLPYLRKKFPDVQNRLWEQKAKKISPDNYLCREPHATIDSLSRPTYSAMEYLFVNGKRSRYAISGVHWGIREWFKPIYTYA